MNRCPITYERCDADYSTSGLKKLSPKLHSLEPLPLDAEGLRLEAALRAGKMSVQGVQPKLSARLEPKHNRFTIVDSGGRFILKPQTLFPNLPENEDLTMRLAKLVGIEVPLHGMIYARDRSLVYFVQRFDRRGRSNKLHLEDFAQLAGRTRDTKYDFSMERLVDIINRHCTFPAIEKLKLFQRVLFNFLVGNEDMHLKNYSLIRDEDGIIRLSPAYDFLNSSIVLRDPVEIALPLDRKQKNLSRRLLIEYWGEQRLGLTRAVIDQMLAEFSKVQAEWHDWIEKSFLPALQKKAYVELLEKRRGVLGI
jgi:serine/threonine-protein kinase HipA